MAVTALAGASLTAVVAGAPPASAAPTRTAARTGAIGGEIEALSGCRNESSSISGAKASGRLCWSTHEISVSKIKLRDSASDGHYAVFRIHFRLKHYGWHTFTTDIVSTKGRRAPVTVTRSKWVYDPKYKVKDFWMQVCKRRGSHRTCDSRWH
ncbi:hypothetical protein [Actinomadura chokoriensis]|uniref:Secreted protein n=1 Tax=Actinomadura chokoriensis TaxID=454156 RepID=A0ABV4R3P2_9ACTN